MFPGFYLPEYVGPKLVCTSLIPYSLVQWVTLKHSSSTVLKKARFVLDMSLKTFMKITGVGGAVYYA